MKRQTVKKRTLCGSSSKSVRSVCVARLKPVEVALGDRDNWDLGYAAAALRRYPLAVAEALKAGKAVVETGNNREVAK